MALSRFVLPFADVGSGITPSSGAKLFFYSTNTSTPLNTFSDAGGATPNTNPVISDANGVFSDIFLLGTYKVVLKDKNDVQKWEADPVEGSQNNSVAYAVSQLANGDATKVAVISVGLNVAAFDYLVYPNDGRIYIAKGVTGVTTGAFNPATGVAAGLSQAVDLVDFMGFGSMYAYAVSQLAAGNASKVALIYPGLAISAFDFFVYTQDGRIYAKNGATGTFSNPLVFNPATGVATGVNGALLNVKQNAINIFDYVVSQLANGNPAIVGTISAGTTVNSFTYLIDSVGRVYSRGSVTGTFSTPLVFNPATGVGTGLSGALVQIIKINESRIAGIESNVSSNAAAILLRATIASPTFTGVPLSTTPTAADDSTKIATTAFVKTEVDTGDTFVLARVLGFSQTNTNLIASRLIGSAVVNTTNKTRSVSVTISAAQGNNILLTAEVDSVRVGRTGGHSASGDHYYCITFLVPSGDTYQLTSAGSATLDTWSECI